MCFDLNSRGEARGGFGWSIGRLVVEVGVYGVEECFVWEGFGEGLVCADLEGCV